MRVIFFAALFGGCGQDSPATPEPFDPEISELVVRPATPVVAAGRTIQLVAEAHTEDGFSYDQNAVVAWTVSDDAILTVSAIGKATGVAEGTVTVTATHPDGPVATVDVQVLASDVESVRVEPAATELLVGDSLQFTATAVLEDLTEQDATDASGWACNNLAAATVDNETETTPGKGLVTGVEPGSATIAASFLGIRGSTSLTVVLAGGL